MKNLSRREALATFGSCAWLLMPLLERRAWGQTAPKKRLIVSMTSSGVMQDVFWPTGTSANYSFAGTTLEPLQALKSKINVIRGLRVECGNYDGHSSGGVALLTGDYVNDETCLGTSCDYPSGRRWARRASIDQMLATRWAGQTPVPSLNLGVRLYDLRPSKFVSYDAGGNYLAPSEDPYEVYGRIFQVLNGKCTGGAPVADAATLALKKRKSVLDAILGDLREAGTRVSLGTEEKVKLDEYTESLRQIERTLASVDMQTIPAGVCEGVAGLASTTRVKIEDAQYPRIARLQMDLMVAAFQLDLTRIATLAWSVGGTGGPPMSWLTFNGQPIREGHHPLTHGEVDPVNWRQKVRIIDGYHAREYAYLLGKLNAIETGPGRTMLDDSLAIWTSELAQGNDHSRDDNPFVIAGSAGGAVATGRYLNVTRGTTHTNLLLSVLHAMGATNLTTVGRPGLCTGKLQGF